MLPLALLLAAPVGASDWEAVDSLESRHGPYQLLRRQQAGSPVTEYRIEAELGVPVERAVAAHVSPPPGGVPDDRRILSDDGEVQVVYMRISAPLIADRDLVLRRERSDDPETGLHRFAWRAVPDQGPPVPEGVVRIRRSEGSWEFRPAPAARTRVRFSSLTDVGGRVPAWVVNRVYRGRVLDEFETLLRKLDALSPDTAPSPP